MEEKKKIKSFNNGSVYMTSILSDELLLEIFLRLPHIFCVFYCRMVCRRWRSVIYPGFFSAFKLHHQHRRPESLPFTLLLRVDMPRVKPSIDFFSSDSQFLHGCRRSADYLSFLPNSSNAVIMSSFIDLLLVRLSPYTDLRICSPLSKRALKLPIPPRHPFPSYWGCRYGLVLRPNSGEYSVVMFGWLRMVIGARIFRSDTRRWDEQVLPFPNGEGLILLGVPVGASNGILYCAMGVPEFDLAITRIAAFDPFDPQREHYCFIDLPDGFGQGWMAHLHRSGIGIVQGKLRLWQFYVTEEAGCFVLKVWELNSDGYWVMVHDARPRMKDCPFSIHAALKALNPCHGDVVFLLDRRPGYRHVWQYHIGRGSCDKICEFDKDWTSGNIYGYALVHPPCPTEIPGMIRYEDPSFAKFMTTILTDDLLLEIFARLPDLLSAWLCRMVCKRWCYVISRSSGFARAFRRHYRLHRRRDSLPFTLLLRGGDFVGSAQLRNQLSMEYFSNGSRFLHGKRAKPSPNGSDYLSFLPNASEAVIRSSFDDLLLVQWIPSYRLCVCNPRTQRGVGLPQPASPPFGGNTFNYGLVVDPHSVCVKYSVVNFGCLPGSGVQALIFRSETGRWDEQVSSFPLEEGLSLQGVPVGASNGVLYCAMGVFESDFVMTRIAAFDPFDPERKHYRMIELPNGYMRERRARRHHSGIGVVQGKMRLWQFYAEEAVNYVVKVWELNLNGYWVVVHDVRPRIQELLFSIHAFPRALHPCDGDVMFLLDPCYDIVGQYNIGSGRCNNIIELDKDCTSGHIFALVHPPCSTRIPSLPPT